MNGGGESFQSSPGLYIRHSRYIIRFYQLLDFHMHACVYLRVITNMYAVVVVVVLDIITYLAGWEKKKKR